MLGASVPASTAKTQQRPKGTKAMNILAQKVKDQREGHFAPPFLRLPMLYLASEKHHLPSLVRPYVRHSCSQWVAMDNGPGPSMSLARHEELQPTCLCWRGCSQ